MVKKFALLSFGVLCLAVAALIVNNLTTPKADAQAAEAISGVFGLRFLEPAVMLSNGDIYVNYATGPTVPIGGQNFPTFTEPAAYLGNFWTGTPPVSTSPETWGKIKSQYNPK